MTSADEMLRQYLANGEMAEHNRDLLNGRITRPRAVTVEEVDAQPKRQPPMYQKIVLMGERPESWNVLKRLHWSKWQKEVERCKQLILAAIGPCDAIQQPVNLTFTPYYSKRPLDTSNFPEKLYEDGLVAAGLLVDDNRKYVHDITKRRAQIDRERPRVEIEITSI